MLPDSLAIHLVTQLRVRYSFSISNELWVCDLLLVGGLIDGA